MTRVIVADDHPLFREGVSTLMGQLMPDAQIVEAGDWSAVERALLDGADPDVLVLDLKFPGLNPVDALPSLRQRYPSASIVVVSMLDDDNSINRVMELGADGFITKALSSAQMRDAFAKIFNGEFVAITGQNGFQASEFGQFNPFPKLTERQSAVLALLARGQSNKEIGRALNISPYTVRIHVSALLRLLKSNTRAEVAAKAMAMRL